MKKINKGPEPLALTAWKKANPRASHATYAKLAQTERQAIRDACTREQFYLCAYCCQSISGHKTDTMNEHVQAQQLAPQLSLSFNNIVASCTTAKQCDDAHGAQPLPLTPLMVECETELRFKISGRVEGLTERARASIRVLNLGDTEVNNKALIEKRKRLSDALLWANGVDPSDGFDDDELLLMLIDDIAQPQDGKLAPFSPVVANILNSWLAG